MSYEPTNWKTGDVVTSAKLNKLENGVAGAGGVLVVHDNDGTLDKTWKEIRDAMGTGIAIVSSIFDEETNTDIITQALISGNEYQVIVNGGSYISDSENGYPVYSSN